MTMDCNDHDLMHTAQVWLAQGEPLVMATVLKTWGSSPRPAGSLMVMRRDGVHAGSVSGGCIEDDLLRRYRQGELGESFPMRLDYGVNREEALRLGLPCGGRLELLLEKLEGAAALLPLLDALQHHRPVVRRVDLLTGEVNLSAATPEQQFASTDEQVSRVFGPRWQMLLIGAGHLSRCVAQLALMLDYRVVVCDPREEYARGWAVEGTKLVTMMPDDAVHHYAAHERTLVITLTHDPKLDDMALLDALESQAFYVGAIGSARNGEARRQRLLQMGLSPAQASRLHAPVGLAIGSHTPAEIAVAILAEITALRNAALPAVRQRVSAA